MSAAGSARVAKHRLVVVGSGWAGFRVLQSVDSRRFDVTLVSLRNHFVFTPLLASTAVGTLEFRCVTEPVKRVPNVQFFEAKCDTVDFANKRVHCSSSFEGFSRDSFSVQYDSLVLAIGAVSNTFNIPGVAEHALFLKDVNDARKIRSRIMECFEHASQPNISDAEKAKLLHFAVVGGGPTGVEFLAELHDFITEDVISLYPDLRPFLSMSIYEAGKKILGAFDDKLSQYAGERFKRKGIELKLGQAVKEVKAGSFVLTTGEVVHYGMLVWSTGLSPVDLVKKLTSGDSEIAGHPVLQKEQQGMGRLVTDHYFRVLDTKGNALQNVFALGDCATVKDRNLPCTAQVANQKGAWLAKALNRSIQKNTQMTLPFEELGIRPFQYNHMGSLAYIGKWRAVADLATPVPNTPKGVSDAVKHFVPNSGIGAWLFWRSAYFTMSVSIKNKILIPMFWFLTWIFGRDISRFH